TITVEVHGDTPIYHSGSMQRPKLHTPSVSNAPQQLDIRPFPRTRHPLEPGIVAGARDPQVLTQSFYGVSSLVFPDESECFCRSSAWKRCHFFKMSFSSSSSATRRFRR